MTQIACKHTRYDRTIPCEHWLIDAFTCWVTLWDTNYMSCRHGVRSGTLTSDLPYANTRIIIVQLPVSTDWLIDAFTGGVSLWDTNYTSCRRGVRGGTLTCDLPYANTCVIIVQLPVSTDWLTRLHAESPFETNYTSCQRGVPSGTEAMLLASIPT